MFFTIKSVTANKIFSRAWVKQGAKLTVDMYRLKPAQKQLDDLIWKVYGLNLKAASLIVIANSKIDRNSSNEFIITFPSKRIDNLASLITYGDGKVQGCDILKEAFLRDV